VRLAVSRHDAKPKPRRHASTAAHAPTQQLPRQQPHNGDYSKRQHMQALQWLSMPMLTRSMKQQRSAARASKGALG